MSTTLHVGHALKDAFKGTLALEGLNMKQGWTGLMRWTIEHPDRAARLIRAHLDGKDAGTQASKPTKQPGGPRPARRHRRTRGAPSVDVPTNNRSGSNKQGARHA